MIFQDCAATTGLNSKMFTSFNCQKFAFEACYGTEAKKLISLLVFAVCFGVSGFPFSAKSGGFFNIVVFRGFV